MSVGKAKGEAIVLPDRLPETEDEVRAYDLFAHVVDVVREGGDDALAWKPIAMAFQEVRAERDAELQLPETVERVARAIREREDQLLDGPDIADADHYRGLAEAALAALVKP